MNISERVTALKPYITGAVIGGVATIAVGFGAGWVVTSDTMDEAVSQAQVSAYAQVCEQNATAHWTSQGNELASLDGWRNEDRKALAEQFSANLSPDKAAQSAILNRCSSLLDPA